MSAPSIMTGIRQVYAVDPFSGLPADIEGSAGQNIYTAALNGVAVVAAQNIIEITAGAKTVVVRGVLLNQFSDFGDAQAEILSVAVYRGGSPGAGSSVVAGRNTKTGAADGTAVVKMNATAPPADGVLVLADGWNVAAGWTYLPGKGDRMEIPPGQSMQFRINAPADSLTCNETIIYEEK